MNILITGGAGYIGSHTLIELLSAGHATIVIDNLSNSSRESLRRVEGITGKSVVFYEADVRDKNALDADAIFTDHQIDAVIHFAGLKAVGGISRQGLAILSEQSRINTHATGYYTAR